MGMREEAFKRFNQIVRDDGKFTKKLPVGRGIKYAVLSDLHAGNGKRPDNFRKNMKIFLKALDYYKRNDFSIILLGDIEEFHQFTLFDICNKYDDSVYDALRKFPVGSVHRVFGNHDIDWALEDPITKKSNQIAVEAIKLGKHVVLTHGQQAEEGYEKDLHVVRLGTTLFKLFEKIFPGGDPRSVTQIPGKKDKIYADWAKESKKIFICGHTHSPIFAGRSIYDWIDIKIQKLNDEIKKFQGNKKKIRKLKNKKVWFRNRKRFLDERRKKTKKPFIKLKSPSYFNSGACLFSDGITNIEIDGTLIRLIHWSKRDLVREQIWEDEDMSGILNIDITA